MYALVVWAGEQKFNFLIIYVLTTIFTFYAHYLFILVILLHLVFVFFIKVLRPYLVVFPFLGIAVIPGAYQLLSLQERASLLSFAQKPTLVSVLQSFFSPALLIVFMIGLLLSIIWGGKIIREKLDTKLICIALIWIALPVIAFAGISTFGSASLFTPRYWSWHVGGVALLFSIIVSALTPIRAQRITVLLLILGMLFRLSVQNWRTEGWRDATVVIKKESKVPVVLYSGLIEAEDSTFPDRGESQAYLSAPLKRYGVSNLIRSIGFKDLGELQNLLPSQEFFFVANLGKRGDLVAPVAFINLFERQGRKVEQISVEGTVTVYKVLGATPH